MAGFHLLILYMDESFFGYLQRLEMMAFFSGYPLIYAVAFFIAANLQSNTSIKRKIVSLLPFSYALVGTLFLGLQIKNLYPDYSFENIKLTTQEPFLKIWGLLSMLFWIPALSKKPVLSLVHSLVFFFFLAKDLFLHIFQLSTDKYMIRNEMKIYSDSLILNLGALAVVSIFYFLIIRFKKNRSSQRLPS